MGASAWNFGGPNKFVYGYPPEILDLLQGLKPD
jgi:hypothetical protein